ncbi:hypothetical protein [Mucilaginibacter xinganensis]|uniref:PH domain-containing protein n=1 Tax=Mucilaginibacter xinganensis TaxID=1234841 RepID=A0A223NTS3_9SPHI|nr:hypothetical protein [Mucilaginibacter xinganensis]ASU33170.1 hypothetical protein MuYL_1272 [Mucilaginibacter xinganensis]
MIPTKYPYSLSFSLASFLVMLALMLLLLTNVLGSSSKAGWLVYGLFVIVFILVGALLIVKRIVPAIKGNTALELNETCIIDYIRNITIDWKDISQISMVHGRSSAQIRVSLKWVSDHGSEITIPLRFVKGNDNDIYNTVNAYFNRAAGDIVL